MSELDWPGLALNGLWVLGAAVILAAFSFLSYDAHRRGERLRVRLRDASFRVWLMGGLFLIELGVSLLVRRWWERGLWGLVCAATGWQLWVAWREWKAEGR